ncbi:MAG: hypothetical protein ACRDQ1_17025 [Sciscionella sp.]
MNMSITSARRGLVLLAAALLTALGLLALTAGHNRASAGPYPPGSGCAISTSDQSVQPGDTITVNGSGFPANTSVALTVHSTPMSLGSIHTDANGSFSDTVTIPSSLVGSNHKIVAASASTTCSFDPFGTQQVAAAQSSKATSGVGGLATTGFAALTASVIAVALLAGGGLLLLLGRRRRQP